jgi:oxygen-independent coproporphyrinogen-3 oxidase
MDAIEKLDLNAPRYTSYPPVPYWNNQVTQPTWTKMLSEQQGRVDVYIHIPYCRSLCYYCGCFKKITKDTNLGDEYVDLVVREWELVSKFNPNLKIHNLHLGGGSPTFLTPAQMERLICFFKPWLSSTFIGSCELDPRTTKSEHLILLKKNGFERLSLGIQDFDIQVQEAINRFQSVSLVRKLVQEIRERGFESLNFDLIYGLPGQNREGFRQTLETVLALGPNSIALYSYAHLPEKLPNQKLIDETSLPTKEQKLLFFHIARDFLEAVGYPQIGIDHFARGDSYLNIAWRKGNLLRNFMGYTDRKSPGLIGLGVSAISSLDGAYVQNTKEITTYRAMLDRGELAIVNGHLLSELDCTANEIIQKIMCHDQFSPFELNKGLEKMGLNSPLEEFKRNGLWIETARGLELTSMGKIFRRNLAMEFDYRLKQTKVQAAAHSSTI